MKTMRNITEARKAERPPAKVSCRERSDGPLSNAKGRNTVNPKTQIKRVVRILLIIVLNSAFRTSRLMSVEPLLGRLEPRRREYMA